MAKRGPRATVLFKQGSGNTPTKRVYMLKSTADFFGFKIDKGIKITRNKTRLTVRGSFGAGSIKVPTGRTGTTRVNGKTVKYEKTVDIPVPSGANIEDIRKFLRTATKNKPDRFATIYGRVYPVADS